MTFWVKSLNFFLASEIAVALNEAVLPSNSTKILIEPSAFTVNLVPSIEAVDWVLLSILKLMLYAVSPTIPLM